MGLVNCPECSKTVSENAEQCPHCGAPLLETIKRKIEALQAEKQELENKSKEVYAKYAEKERKITVLVYGTPAQQAADRSSERKGWVITVIISAIILLIHLFNPNWWLLLTIPFCLVFIVLGLVLAIDPDALNSNYDDPTPNAKVVEKNRLMEPVNRERDAALRQISERRRTIDEAIKALSIHMR